MFGFLSCYISWITYVKLHVLLELVKNIFLFVTAMCRLCNLTKEEIKTRQFKN